VATLSSQFPAGTDRRFKFDKRGQLFIGARNETLFVVAMRIGNSQPLIDALIRVYGESGNVIETHEHKGRFQRVVSFYSERPVFASAFSAYQRKSVGALFYIGASVFKLLAAGTSAAKTSSAGIAPPALKPKAALSVKGVNVSLLSSVRWPRK
jgi:hypothetical protein